MYVGILNMVKKLRIYYSDRSRKFETETVYTISVG